MKEIRHIEVRAEHIEDTKEMVITGTPVVFNTPTVINDPKGKYTEVIKRNAFDGVDLTDTRLLINHDFNSIPLAKAPKTMKLWADDKGLQMRAVLPHTEEGRSAYAAVKSERMTGMSFSFTTDTAGNQFDVEKRTRIISKINKLFECSIVNFPAYQTASVEARSQMQEAEHKLEQTKQARIKLNKILSREII